MDCYNFVNDYCDLNCDLLRFLKLSQTDTDEENEVDYSKLFQHASPCKYYQPDHSLFHLKLSNSLFILHSDTRSLNKNFSTLKDLLNSFHFPPDAIGVSKTWLKSELDKNSSLPGYNFIHETSASRAGGVALYISNKFNFEIAKDLTLITLTAKICGLNSGLGSWSHFIFLQEPER